MDTENPSHKQEGRPVRLFRNGRNQAIRIPREFGLQCLSNSHFGVTNASTVGWARRTYREP
jgi:hypothetical protein